VPRRQVVYERAEPDPLDDAAEPDAQSGSIHQ
jgi:hypothetical protein